MNSSTLVTDPFIISIQSTCQIVLACVTAALAIFFLLFVSYVQDASYLYLVPKNALLLLFLAFSAAFHAACSVLTSTGSRASAIGRCIALSGMQVTYLVCFLTRPCSCHLFNSTRQWHQFLRASPLLKPDRIKHRTLLILTVNASICSLIPIFTSSFIYARNQRIILLTVSAAIITLDAWQTHATSHALRSAVVRASSSAKHAGADKLTPTKAEMLGHAAGKGSVRALLCAAAAAACYAALCVVESLPHAMQWRENAWIALVVGCGVLLTCVAGTLVKGKIGLDWAAYMARKEEERVAGEVESSFSAKLA
ncbi:hypothetical protein BC830DRAFT_1115694 [Chytriomyces sp. MP71]|nr:hypothetical protein BC830DRAFT_1115694 [Chytriomyces sp. MP71]